MPLLKHCEVPSCVQPVRCHWSVHRCFVVGSAPEPPNASSQRSCRVDHWSDIRHTVAYVACVDVLLNGPIHTLENVHDLQQLSLHGIGKIMNNGKMNEKMNEKIQN